MKTRTSKKAKQTKERVLNGAMYIIENRTTIRETAKYLNISKSCVHYDIKNNLEKFSPSLYVDVINILNYNKAVRHLRGGQATQRKFKMSAIK